MKQTKVSFTAKETLAVVRAIKTAIEVLEMAKKHDSGVKRELATLKRILKKGKWA